jgi:hypothetical protein
VTLTWTASATPSVWYWIEWRVAGGAWQERKLDSTCCSYVVSLLTNGTRYEFRLRATNVSGDSAATAIVAARPMPPVPLPPSNLTAAAGDGTVRLAWSASPTPHVWYWIEYRANGGAWRRISLPLKTCCTHTVSLLFNGTTYDFRLVSTNLSGDSAPSNVARARPLPALPQPPTNLRAFPGTGHVTLQWNASPSGPVYYWIEYRRAGGAWQRLAYPLGGCCAFDVKYLQNGVTYEFRVRASNLAGDSVPSNVVSARPTPPAGSCWLAALTPKGHPTYPRIWIPKAAYSCTAVMHSASVTVYLWTNYYGIWHRDTVSTTRRLGSINVGQIRSGFIDAWVAAPEGGCFLHKSEVVAAWTDVNGNRRRLAETSRTVRLNDKGEPC